MEPMFQANQIIEHLYIHIPFCLKKCLYCSFYSVDYNPEQCDSLIQDLKTELDYYTTLYHIQPKTIYLGGGTPSLLETKHIQTLISDIDLSQLQEFTIELNPGTVQTDKLNDYLSLGINRLSLGVQSFNNKLLKYLGRIHNFEQIATTINQMKSIGFKNISIDLIYGIKNQSVNQFIDSIQHFLKLDLQHLSFYGLSLEENVPLYKDINDCPSDRVVEKSYISARDLLEMNKYQQYEISNFSLPGYESKHNLAYWTGKYYLALGPSASGYLHKIRYTNPSDINQYHQMIKDNTYFKDSIILSESDLEVEYLITRLRLKEGFNLDDFSENFKSDFNQKYHNQVNLLYHNDYLEILNNQIRINPKYYLVSNEILNRFV